MVGCGNGNAGNGEFATLEEAAKIGDLESKISNYKELRNRCKESIDDGNTALDVYLYYGEALSWLEESDEDLNQALEAYKKAAEISPDSQEITRNIVDIYIRMQDYDAAKDILTTNENLDDETRQQWLAMFEPMDNGRRELKDNDYNVRKISYYENGDCTDYVVINYYHGQRANATYYQPDGQEIGYIEYEYDNQKNEIQGFDNAWLHFSLVRSEYNENNQCIKKTRYYPNGKFHSEEQYTYFENGSMKSHWFKYDPFKSIDLIEYNEQGQELKSTSYDENENVRCYTIYEYEESRDKYTLYNADGSVNYSFETLYDQNHDWISETKYDAEGNIIEQRLRNN